MRPSRDQVLQLLQEAKQDSKNERWIRHSICVGDTAKTIADALNQKGYSLNSDKLQLLGYLHDCGKITNLSATHPISGYRYMQNLGYDESFCIVSLTHHFINNDPTCTLCIIPDPAREEFLINFIKNHDFSLEDKIIGLCDSMCTYQAVTLEDRMIDCIARHGVCSGTQKRINAILTLKTELDSMLGYDLYKLFPDIRT